MPQTEMRAAYQSGYCEGFEGASADENPFRSPSQRDSHLDWFNGWGEGANDADAGREPKF